MVIVSTGHCFLDICSGRESLRKPIWLMRQAGRYLPEYRELRSRAGGFLEFCYAPALAAEATLQPMRRFDLDAAIVFADILLVPHAMGMNVRFVEGEGPLLDPIASSSGLSRDFSRILDRLSPVFETIERVTHELRGQAPLIGFCGGPWTVATYMLEGKGGTTKEFSRRLAYEKPADLAEILDLLVEASALYLARQVKAGAAAVQIFESWAGGLPPELFHRIVIDPTRRLVARLRELGVTVPIIGFPRGAGMKIADYAAQTGVNVLALDEEAGADGVARLLPASLPVQGNIDPQALVIGGDVLRSAVRTCMDGFHGRPHIVNLGHGIRPEVPPQHVADLISFVRDYS